MLNLSYALKGLVAASFAATLFSISCGSKDLDTQVASTVSVSPTPTTQTDATTPMSELLSRDDCRGFYEAFPKTFKEFDELYGYEDGNGGGKLYPKYEEQIPYFFNCSEVSSTERIRKIISIGINGKWDADAVGLFQDLALKAVKTNTVAARQMLDALPEKEASSFWYFLFDGPHPEDKQKRANFAAIQDLLGPKSKQSELLEKQFEILLKLEKGGS
ncbi:MAG: hypothetical protein ABI857_02825 [Acidobacteriota bacterium]